MGIHGFGNCNGCHMARIAKSSVAGDIALHSFKVVYPKESISKGGVDKQPNSCNSCHYHKDDPPDKLQRYIEKIKESFYK